MMGAKLDNLPEFGNSRPDFYISHSPKAAKKQKSKQKSVIMMYF